MFGFRSITLLVVQDADLKSLRDGLDLVVYITASALSAQPNARLNFFADVRFVAWPSTNPSPNWAAMPMSSRMLASCWNKHGF
jgi:hypothetical protein